MELSLINLGLLLTGVYLIFVSAPSLFKNVKVNNKLVAVVAIVAGACLLIGTLFSSTVSL